jgi:hypothetical protein
LTVKAFVPWPKKPPAQAGLELSVPTPRDARVGQPIDIVIQAAVPAGFPFTIRHALPAGVQPDSASLDALVTAGAIAGYDREDGAVTLRVAPRPAGQSFAARYRAVPTLAGTLGTASSTISARGERQEIPPTRWVVR